MTDEDRVWQEVATAPFNRELELAVIEGDHVYTVVFACRRTARGWVKASSAERIVIHPSHWRVWTLAGRDPELSRHRVVWYIAECGYRRKSWVKLSGCSLPATMLITEKLLKHD